MAFVMQVLGTRASRFMITMGKRNPSLRSGAAFTPNGPALDRSWASAVNRLVGSHPEGELLLLRPNKAAAAVCAPNYCYFASAKGADVGGLNFSASKGRCRSQISQSASKILRWVLSRA